MKREKENFNTGLDPSSKEPSTATGWFREMEAVWDLTYNISVTVSVLCECGLENAA